MTDSGPPTLTGAAVVPGSIGVAIAIPEPFGSQLQAMRSSFGDPLADAIPTHVTLLPPTALDPGELDVVGEHLDKVARQHDPFDMHLRGSATFRPVSRWCSCSCPRASASASSWSATCGTARSAPGPSTSHTTRMSRWPITCPRTPSTRPRARLADYECSFVVDGFQLYLHGHDGVWRVARDFWFGSS